MTRKLIIVFFLCTCAVSYANEYLDSLYRANTYYTKGDYEKAITGYHYILASGYESADLYYNLGNAYYKSYKNTLAIYYYEKALRLSPNDKDIKHNLEVANTFIVDKIDVVPEFFLTSWLKKVSHLLPMDGWAYASLASFVICLLLILCFLFTSRPFFKKFSFLLGIIFFLTSLIMYGLSHKQKKWLEGGNEAIVFSPTVNIKSSPDENGNNLFILHEGIKIKITNTFGEWNEIELSNGNKGWIKLSDLLII